MNNKTRNNCKNTILTFVTVLDVAKVLLCDYIGKDSLRLESGHNASMNILI